MSSPINHPAYLKAFSEYMNFKRLRDGCEVNPNEAPWVVYIRNCRSNVPTVLPDCIPDCTPDCTPDCISKHTQTDYCPPVCTPDCTPDCISKQTQTDCPQECTPDCTPDCISNYIIEYKIKIEGKRQVNLIIENLVRGYF